MSTTRFIICLDDHDATDEPTNTVFLSVDDMGGEPEWDADRGEAMQFITLDDARACIANTPALAEAARNRGALMWIAEVHSTT